MSLFKNDIFSESFSVAGKDSLRKYNICFKKKIKKSVKKHLLFNSYLFVAKQLEEDSNNFKFNIKNDILNEDIEKTDLFFNDYKEKNKNLLQSEKYKYHKMNEKLMELKRKKFKLNKDKEISITEKLSKTNYDINNKTKMKLIFNWKKLVGRNQINKQKENEIKNRSDINIKTNNNKQIGFIDMAKQTQRNDNIFLSGDVRKINLKQYVAINSKLEREKWKKFCKRPLIAKSPFSSDNISISNIRRHIPYFQSAKIKKKFNYNLTDDINKNKNSLSSSKKNSVVDFKKILSRQKLDKNKKEIIRIKTQLKPNYNYINERLKIFQYRKEKNFNKKFDFRNLNWDEYYPTMESFDYIYGHKLKSVPNFIQMISRPNDNDLPSYMYGIHNGMCEFNPDLNLNYDNSTDKNNISEINNKIKEKRNDKNKKNKSKCLLNKFINLYGELFYPSKK